MVITARFSPGNINPNARSSHSGWILSWLIALSAVVGSGVADVPEAQQAEVDHLLAFVQNSDCQFIRNGAASGNAAAVNHIRRKYRHFRDQIEDTESFIELTASISTISGQHYIITCPGQPEQNSGDWLMGELVRFRKESPTAE